MFYFYFFSGSLSKKLLVYDLLLTFFTNDEIHGCY